MMASSWVEVDRKGRRGTSEAVLPLRAFTCSTTELRTCVRKESNLRPCGHEVTALFTTGRGDTIREQAIAETPARRSPCGPGSALSAELPAHGTPGGIRTRDLSFRRRSNSDLHHGSCSGWRGPGDAVVAPKSSD